MDNSIKPFATASALSLTLHGMAAVAAVLLLPGEFTPPAKGVGPGLNLELISSQQVADNRAAEKATRKRTIAASPEQVEKVLRKVLIVKNSQQAVSIADAVKPNRPDKQRGVALPQLDVTGNKILQRNLATNASQQQHSIIELLHSRISDNKEYPYLARRQRREGVATVEFVLHPDGKIENAQLINSSHATTLDRAALSAVKSIEPFAAAQKYLDQSEKFQINVVFKLL